MDGIFKTRWNITFTMINGKGGGGGGGVFASTGFVKILPVAGSISYFLWLSREFLTKSLIYYNNTNLIKVYRQNYELKIYLNSEKQY